MQENREPRTENRRYTYRNLILWQKSQELTLKIIRRVALLPERDRAAEVIAKQILRSSSSVGANIAEGHGRYSLAAHANYLSIAKASACETDNWLDLLRRADYLDRSEEASLHTDCEEIIRMLTSKILKLEEMARSRKATLRVSDDKAIYQTNSQKIDEEFIATYDATDYADANPVLGSGFSVQSGEEGLG